MDKVKLAIAVKQYGNEFLAKRFRDKLALEVKQRFDGKAKLVINKVDEDQYQVLLVGEFDRHINVIFNY